jgi:3-phosphoshikimate 1-carboxyvinyltransferase
LLTVSEMPKHKYVHLRKMATVPSCSIAVPSSKSESNRALIINSFAKGRLHNLSTARDTQTLHNLLQSKAKVMDVMDAGTTMRFLLAYYALTNQYKTLTGTERMCERPIGILVDALTEVGAEIHYLRNTGFPPVETHGFPFQKTNEISIRGDVSSQYISAIMMLAPTLPHGLTINLTGTVGSKPYLLMTQGLMQSFGVHASFEGDSRIVIKPGVYRPVAFSVEADWSGASYWFSFAALAHEANIELAGLRKNSLQGDMAIMEIMKHLGVRATFSSKGLLLEKSSCSDELEWDFSDCPDLAQTVAVVCAARGVKARFTGMESLRIKETDRIAALQKELVKIGASMHEKRKNQWELQPAEGIESIGHATIETYDDHRMAMAFAPLATLMNITILHPAVTDKSYPTFWDDVMKAGYEVLFEF